MGTNSTIATLAVECARTHREQGDSTIEVVNTRSGERAPAHRIGVTDDGRSLYALPEGWALDAPHELDADGNAVVEVAS